MKKLATILAILLICISAKHLATNDEQLKQADKINIAAIQIATCQDSQKTDIELLETPDPAPIENTDPINQYLNEINLTNLQDINPDVKAWLYIPSTNINYPVVQGESNQTYLRTAWNKTKSNSGSIFLDAENTLDDANLIIYGHNMRSGSMFAELYNYQDEDFLSAHPAIYLKIDDEVRTYQIFNVAITSKYDPLYEPNYQRENTDAQCLVLSTCNTGDNRLIVQAQQVK